MIFRVVVSNPAVLKQSPVKKFLWKEALLE
jgi:hypothetical protein